MEVSELATTFQHIGSAAFGLSLLAWFSAVVIARIKYRLQGAQISRDDLKKDPIVSSAEFLAISAILVSVTLFYTSEIVIDIKQDDSNVLQLISHPLFIPFACASAVVFYLIRCRAQRLYGLIEISIGIFSISLASASPGPKVKIDSVVKILTVDSVGKILAILGGIYIIVRGLDNVDKALTDGEFKLKWDRLFHGKRNPSRFAETSQLADNPARSQARPKARLP